MMTQTQTAALLSRLIYEPWEKVHQGLRAIQMEMIGDPFDVMGSQGMLVLGHGRAYLVFRGTEATEFKLLNPIPWVREMRSNFGLPVEWVGNGKAHNGYVRHFSYIRRDARKMAEKIPTPIPLIIVGHSLGGCLATCYASWIASGRQYDHKIAGLITFGAPKCLNAEALADIACPILRFTNKYDFAPHWQPIPGLTQPKNQVKINSGGWIGPVTRHSATKYQKATP